MHGSPTLSLVVIGVLTLLLLPSAAPTSIPSLGPSGRAPSHAALPLPSGPSPLQSTNYSSSSGSVVLWSNLTRPWSTSGNESLSATAYDPVSGDLVAYGGSNNLTTGGVPDYGNATWVMDPSGLWRELPTPASPPPMVGASLQYLASPYDEFLLFGGMNSTTSFDETWALNLTSLRWTQLPEPVHPSRRVIAMTAEMPGDTGFYLFGGANASGGILGLVQDKHYFNDTWKFTPSAGWSNLTRTGPGPLSRAGGWLLPTGQPSTYLLYGGVTRGTAGPELLSDTWLYNASTDAWTSTSALGSPYAFGGCGIYDPQSHEDLYLDGYGYAGTADDAWRWSYAQGQWSQATTYVGLPARGIVGGGCAWDPAAGGAILFGGLYAYAVGIDTVIPLNSTYLVRDLGFTLGFSTGSRFLQGLPFNATVETVNYLGTRVLLNLTTNLSDSSGTLTPPQLTVTEGWASAPVTVWREQGNDTLTGCGLGICLSETLPFSLSASQIEVLPPPGTVVAGTPFAVGLRVVNGSGQLVNWWNGPATLAVAPVGSLHAMSLVNGSGSATLEVNRSGNYSLLGLVPDLPAGQAPLQVTHAALATLTVALSASSVGVGGRIGLSFQATDRFGNPVPVQSVNVSDTLHDVAPVRVNVSASAGNLTLGIGTVAGIDTLSLRAAGITGLSGTLTVTAVKGPPSGGLAPAPGSDILYLLLALVTAIVLVALLLLEVRRRRRRKAEEERKKKKKKGKDAAAPYIGFVPFLANQEEEERERKESD